MEMKKCSKCKKSMPKSKKYFYVDNSSKSGFKSRCKLCEGNVYAINDRYGLFDVVWKDLECISGIYKITCKKNNKFYVGSAVNICKRWSVHLNELRNNIHSNTYMQNAFNMYGEKSFDFEIIETVFDVNFLIKREQDWLDKLKPYDRKIGFNILKMASNSLGHKTSNKTKEKLKRVLNKPVLQYDLNGKLITWHLSAREASRQYGYSKAQICNCANRKINKYKDYIWIYEADKGTLQERLDTFYKMQRTVLQYSLEGVLVKEWMCSISEISKQLGKVYINIPNCCNGNQETLGGFKWKYRYGIEPLKQNLSLRETK